VGNGLHERTAVKVARYVLRRRGGSNPALLFDYNEWDISFFTGLPGYVVKEYIEIIKDYDTRRIDKDAC